MFNNRIVAIVLWFFNRLPWAFLLSLLVAYVFYYNMNKRISDGEKPAVQQISTENVPIRKTQSDSAVVFAVSDSAHLNRIIPHNITTKLLMENSFVAIGGISIGFACLGLMIIGFAYWDYTRTLRMEQYVRDKDPDRLHALFVAHTDKFSKFETPRKLKRFSNRARFQYNLLTLSNLINSDSEADFFFDVLIILEGKRAAVLQPFDKFCASVGERIADNHKMNFLIYNDLLQKIYEINRNVLI